MNDLKRSADADANDEPSSLETSEANEADLAAKSTANDLRRAANAKRYGVFNKDTPKRRASDKKD